MQLESLFQHLADPAFTSDATAGPQIGAALTALRLTGTDATAEALAIASRVFLQRCIHVDLPELAPSLRAGQSGVRSAPKADDEEEDEPYEGALDLVGTGGDGHDTFNVSTTAAIVAAGVPGCRICKVSCERAIVQRQVLGWLLWTCVLTRTALAALLS